jgi:hypothetical protein
LSEVVDLVSFISVSFSVASISKNLWPICGQNSQHIAVRRWQRMGKNCKTLDFLWWLQL